MNLSNSNRTRRWRESAFSLIELMLAFSIMTVMFVTMYLGLSSGFGVVQLARENLRGTQILQEKMETIRLYTWDQINTTGFLPATFTEDFFASTGSVSGLVYTGTVSVANAPITEAYSNDLKQVTITVKWKSGGVMRNREMTTFVAKNGLQAYIY